MAKLRPESRPDQDPGTPGGEFRAPVRSADPDNGYGHGVGTEASAGMEQWEGETPAREEAAGESAAELERLRAENEELRAIIAEMRTQLDDAMSKGQDVWADREREYEGLLEEKSEVIRNLHIRMQELEKYAAAGPPVVVPKEEELLGLSDELDRERCQIEQDRKQLEEDRRQLREDEDSMMKQMREMEIGMAKERAELHRKGIELQRLQAEIRHEIEQAQRDSTLNERLRMLQRKSQDAGGKGGGELPPSDAPPPTPSQQPSGRKESGVFRRFFG